MSPGYVPDELEALSLDKRGFSNGTQYVTYSLKGYAPESVPVFDTSTCKIEYIHSSELKKFTWRKPNQAWSSVSMYSPNPQVGTDPECFLWDGKKRIPAFEVLGDKVSATKDAPWFWDGFQAETRVSPSTCNESLLIYLSRVFGKLPRGLQIHPSTVWKIPQDMLYHASDAHVALGCDASFNAYDYQPRRVEEPRFLNWRFAGGHIHFGLSEFQRANDPLVRDIVKGLDVFLGIPCVALFQNVDHFIRRRYYGAAGEYRLPTHGLEYRTLSNAWAQHPLSYMLTFDLAKQAFKMGKLRFRRLFPVEERLVQNTINYCDVRAAKAILKTHKDYYDAFCGTKYSGSNKFWDACERGIDKVIPGFGQDVLGSWLGHETISNAPHWSTFEDRL